MSDIIGPILEQGFAVLGRFGLVGRMEKFLKRRNFCLSMLLFWVVFSTFWWLYRLTVYSTEILASAWKSYMI